MVNISSVNQSPTNQGSIVLRRQPTAPLERPIGATVLTTHWVATLLAGYEQEPTKPTTQASAQKPKNPQRYIDMYRCNIVLTALDLPVFTALQRQALAADAPQRDEIAAKAATVLMDLVLGLERNSMDAQIAWAATMVCDRLDKNERKNRRAIREGIRVATVALSIARDEIALQQARR